MKKKSTEKPSPRWQHLAMISGILMLALVFTYKSTGGEELNYDDERYIRGNELIRNLDGRKVVEIFTTFFDGHYHPLSLLSLAIDRQLSDDPIRAHHLVNWLLHVANAMLVYLFLLVLFRKRWLAFGVAALFVVHPMTVESYAWMTERKNVLYSFFFLAACISYVRYLEKGAKVFLALCFGLFVLSILSKAQAMVLLPVLFLLHWTRERDFRKAGTYVDKIPFLLVALAFVFLTSAAQNERWDLSSPEYSRIDKLFLASWAFIQYFVKGLVPVGLSAYYPYPNDLGQELQWYHYAAPAGLLVFGAAAVYAFRRSKIVIFALAFFFLNLVLMLKFLDVPHGSYLMANRYNYLPLVGLMLLLVHGIFWLAGRYRMAPASAALLLLAVALPYGVISQQRIAVWQNSVNLWSDIIEKYPAYKHAWNMRGLGYLEKGKTHEARQDFETMLELDPNFEDAYSNLAILHHQLGQHEKAADYVKEAKQRFADNPRIYTLAANLALARKDFQSALEETGRALEIDPGNESAQIAKAKALVQLNRTEEARQVLGTMGQNAQAQRLLAALQTGSSQSSPPGKESNRAAQFMQQATELAKQGRYQDAMRLYNQVVEFSPEDHLVYLNRGTTLARVGEVEKALEDFKQARQLKPDDGRVHYLLGVAYKDLNQPELACAHLRQADKLGIAVNQELRNYCDESTPSGNETRSHGN